jgi:hypothetical protein
VELGAALEDEVADGDVAVPDGVAGTPVAVMPGGGVDVLLFSATEPFMKTAVMAAAMKAMTNAPRTSQIQLYRRGGGGWNVGWAG